LPASSVGGGTAVNIKELPQAQFVNIWLYLTAVFSLSLQPKTKIYA
jgi:hypothetical protein